MSSLVVVVFNIIIAGLTSIVSMFTLPVEFNASKRALETIESNHFMTDSEYFGAKKVLTAAALTYVAALASALATIFRLLLVVNGGNRR